MNLVSNNLFDKFFLEMQSGQKKNIRKESKKKGVNYFIISLFFLLSIN